MITPVYLLRHIGFSVFHLATIPATLRSQRGKNVPNARTGFNDFFIPLVRISFHRHLDVRMSGDGLKRLHVDAGRCCQCNIGMTEGIDSSVSRLWVTFGDNFWGSVCAGQGMLSCPSLTAYSIAGIALGVLRHCAASCGIVRQLSGGRFALGRVTYLAVFVFGVKKAGHEAACPGKGMPRMKTEI